MPVVAIAANDPLYDKVLSNLQEVRARKARLISIATEGDPHISALSEHVVFYPGHDLHPAATANCNSLATAGLSRG
jgi:glucosamine 6-phosphate synthetase-like amidotransferase/phosphosugar isomerase protein